jgi:hypothetical protein
MSKKLSTSMFLLNSVLLAHYFGGANFHITKYFLILAFSTIYLLPDHIETGPKLAYFVLVFQGIGHVSLEISGATSSRMSTNHLLAGFVTYHFIVRFDEIVEKISDWFIPLKITILELIPTFTSKILYFDKFISRYSNYDFSLRGPPKPKVF